MARSKLQEQAALLRSMARVERSEVKAETDVEQREWNKRRAEALEAAAKALLHGGRVEWTRHPQDLPSVKRAQTSKAYLFTRRRLPNESDLAPEGYYFWSVDSFRSGFCKTEELAQEAAEKAAGAYSRKKR